MRQSDINRLKARADHRGSRHIELGREIQKWQQYEGGPDAAPPGIKTAGIRARNRLAEENIGLVYRYCNRKELLLRHCVGVTADDFFAECTLGLLRACERYDPSRSTRFSTVCEWWLMQSCNRFVTQNRTIIKVSSTAVQRANRIAKGNATELDLEPKAYELARCFWDALNADSLDRPITDEGEPLHEIVAAPAEAEPYDYSRWDEAVAIEPRLVKVLEGEIKGARRTALILSAREQLVAA